MTLKTMPLQAKRIRQLARKLCCNYFDGNCLFLDNGDTHKCVQLISMYGIYCNYFMNAVLPADKELYEKILQKNKSKN